MPTESTAINALIDLAQRRVIRSDEELFDESETLLRDPVRHPAPQSQGATVGRAPTMPVPQPLSAAQVIVDAVTLPTGRVEPIDSSYNVTTMPVDRAPSARELAGKLALPMLLLVCLGTTAGGFVAFSGERAHHAAKPAAAVGGSMSAAVTAHVSAPTIVQPAPAAVAEATAPAPQPAPPTVTPPPAPTPALAPAPEAPAAPPAPTPMVAVAAAAPAVSAARPLAALVSIRLASEPSGATVTLLDNAKPTPLGTTPIDAAIDPTRSYDVVFTLAGHPTQIARLDPTRMRQLAVAMGGPPAAPAPAPATPSPAATATAHHKHAAHAAHAAARARSAAVETSAATGVLMVSAKPPCSIVVDGKPTGLTTPQRSLALAAGSHQVTLINAGEHVKQTFGVQIHPHQSTKLIRNFLAE